MLRYGIFKKIVLCLTLCFCQSAQLLETGYDYYRSNNNALITNHSPNYDDLKCAYLFSGLTHMRLVELLIDHLYDSQTKLSTGIINYYSHTVKYQIASLYSVGANRMGGLWLVHLYTSMVTWFYANCNNVAEGYGKIVATARYVIEKLRKDTTGCRRGNLFDSYDELIQRNPRPTPDALKTMLARVNCKAKNLLKANHAVFRAKLCDGKFEEALKIRKLFMNGVGLYGAYKTDLMNVYNVNVDWSDTGRRLKESWFDARTLDWSADNLGDIKRYFTLTYSFLKIIMFRLTLKHITCLQDYAVGSYDHAVYARQWYDLVAEFGSMLNLTEDLHVDSLLTAFYDLTRGTQKTDTVVSYLVSTLVALCRPFGCAAAEPFRIADNKEFQTPYTSTIRNDLRQLEITSSRVPIEYNSLENTRLFLYYLRRVFNRVDFGLVRLLVEYIDDIKIENYTDRFRNFYISS